MMDAFRPAALAVRFLAELAALAALSAWGWATGRGLPARVALALAAPLAAALAWGAFVSPKARWPLPDPARFLVEAVVFAAAGAALLATGHRGLAVALLAAWLATAVVVRA